MEEDTKCRITFGIRIPLNSYKKVELDSIDLDGPVPYVRNLVSHLIGIESDQILLTHGGVELEDNSGKTLRDYGLKPGYTIHVLRGVSSAEETGIKLIKNMTKNDITNLSLLVITGESPSKTKMNDKDINKVAVIYKSFALHPRHRHYLEKLIRPDKLEIILNAYPKLKEDPVAYSILRDPELLLQMSDTNALRKVVKEHPALAEAVNYLAATVLTKVGTSKKRVTTNRNRAGQGSSSSTSAEGTSSTSTEENRQQDNDEEMDSSESSEVSEDSSTNRASITTSQLEAAIAALSGGPTPSTSGQNRPGAIITSEMFSNALQQVFQGISVPRNVAGSPSAGPSASTTAVPTGSAVTPSPEISLRVQQLQQMRELGLRDEVFNGQALEITNGDLQAAIELVLSSDATGGMSIRDDDDDDDSFRQ